MSLIVWGRDDEFADRIIQTPLHLLQEGLDQIVTTLGIQHLEKASAVDVVPGLHPIELEVVNGGGIQDDHVERDHVRRFGWIWDEGLKKLKAFSLSSLDTWSSAHLAIFQSGEAGKIGVTRDPNQTCPHEHLWCWLALLA